MTVDLDKDADDFHLVQLSGSWARECYVQQRRLSHGTTSFGSTRGVSGHNHSPFAAITVGPPNEEHGECKAFALVYSGNYQCECQVNEVSWGGVAVSEKHVARFNVEQCIVG